MSSNDLLNTSKLQVESSCHLSKTLKATFPACSLTALTVVTPPARPETPAGCSAPARQRSLGAGLLLPAGQREPAEVCAASNPAAGHAYKLSGKRKLKEIPVVSPLGSEAAVTLGWPLQACGAALTVMRISGEQWTLLFLHSARDSIQHMTLTPFPFLYAILLFIFQITMDVHAHCTNL